MDKHIRYGQDEYGRYTELDGVRFSIEVFPFVTWHPITWLLYVWKWVEIGLWKLSHSTGILWQDD